MSKFGDWNPKKYLVSSIQVRKYASMKECKCESIKSVQICKHVRCMYWIQVLKDVRFMYGMQVCKYASMQACKYVSMQVIKHASMKAWKHEIMQVCKYARM